MVPPRADARPSTSLRMLLAAVSGSSIEQMLMGKLDIMYDSSVQRLLFPITLTFPSGEDTNARRSTWCDPHG